jgi:hypothetical protein
MRVRLTLLALMTVAAAWSASAQPTADDARADFQGELSRQCPDKQLQMLSARNLSDGLDDYKQSLPAEARDRIDQAETAQCSSTYTGGAACTNASDLMVVEQIGRMPDLAGSICDSFLRCRTDGDCDYAR